MILSYFDHLIRPQLLKLINSADSEIVACVAWFTDNTIFASLEKALERGVKLRLLFQDDDINRNAPFELSDLARKGAQIWLWNPLTQGTMHHKFMVVDSEFVMVGSYNWTIAAAGFNKENANIFSGTEAPIKDYLTEFEDICSQATLHVSSPENIITELIYKDFKASLRIRILELETLISELEQDKAESQGIIDRFLLYIRQQLRDTILHEMLLKAEYARLQAEKSKKRSDKETYEDLKKEFTRNQETFNVEKNKSIPVLYQEDLLSMKQMFREAVLAAHPDRFNGYPEKEAKANEITARLNNAYRNNDIETVRDIWQSLRDGTAFGIELSSIDDLDKLEILFKKLELKLNNLTNEINSIKSDKYFSVAINSEAWEAYLLDLELQIKRNIGLLSQEIEKLK